jgi:hypothetical protein
MKKIYNFISKYKKEILVILILIIISISIYYFYNNNNNNKNIEEFFTTPIWEQLGSPILGEIYQYSFENSGNSVALSSNGKIVAISSPYYITNKNSYGRVKVFELNQNNEWIQLGNNIEGMSGSNYMCNEGYSISLSANGKIIAIGAPYTGPMFGGGVYNGYVIVFELNDNDINNKKWEQMGDNIYGNTATEGSDNFGISVSLSSDGQTLAIGAPGTDNNNQRNSGQVIIYKWNTLFWTQLGQDIKGDATDDQNGTSVSLSFDGKKVAIGARFTGRVRIFKLYGTTWGKLGQDIYGENDQSGYSVSLSGDGNTVAIGAPYNDNNNKTKSGTVRIFELDGTMWKPLGQNINGETSNEQSGYSVSLSNDGKIVAIRSFNNNNNNRHIKVYQWNETSWTQLGDDITAKVRINDNDGNVKYDYSGWVVSLSSDGTSIAYGLYGNDNNGNYQGSIEIYKISPVDCIGSFVNDGECSATCGGGKQKQIYQITESAQFDGETCPNQDGEEKEIDCNTQDCSINCVGSFGAFNSCSAECGGGTKSRTYTIQTNAEHGGATCPHTNGHIDTQNCNTQDCPIDCVGSFGAFDTCDKNCGGGTKSRTYTIQTNAEHGGATCPHTNGHIDTQNCNTQPCIPGDCVGSFGAFDTCNKDCGGGTKSRTYTIQTNAVHGGSTCPYTNGHIDTQNCNTNSCSIDCKGYFEDFNICSEDCGENGFKLKKFIVETQAQNGGKQCTYYNKEILQNETITDSQYVSEPCNRQPCTTYPHKLIIKNTLTEKDIELQKIRYNILDRQSKLNILTNNFNTIDSNISDLKNNSNYIPDDNTLKFF